jgi:hypothetical protein
MRPHASRKVGTGTPIFLLVRRQEPKRDAHQPDGGGILSMEIAKIAATLSAHSITLKMTSAIAPYTPATVAQSL